AGTKTPVGGDLAGLIAGHLKQVAKGTRARTGRTCVPVLFWSSPMPSKKKHPLSDPRNWSPETQLVHGGTMRSRFNETSEAIFLNSGYAYPNSQHAEDVFTHAIEGHNYSRFANP